MNKEKCFICDTEPKHKFQDCMSTSCGCQCVQEIYLSANTQEDGISPQHPKFLEVDQQEVMEVLNWEHEIRNFNKIDKSEWIKTKKDHRLKINRRKR